jgi:hypothetical protein
MSTINIEVLDVKVEQKGKSNRLVCTHKDIASGKIDGKQLVEFYTDKAVWSTLASAKAGDVFSIEREKNDAGYWEWKTLSRQDGAVAPQTVATATKQARSTYETPEERTHRQIMIVRQSSISSAVDLCKDHGKQPDPEQVIKVAKMFEAYVLDLPNKEPVAAGLLEDVPL